MAAIEVTSEHWPVVLVKFDADQTMADTDRFMRAFDELHAKKQPYVSISYMRRYARDRDQVQKVAEWMKRTAEDTRRYCLATGIITQSLGFRFLLTSIFLVRPMSCPYRVCGSFADALAFVTAKATEHGLTIPSVPNLWNV